MASGRCCPRGSRAAGRIAHALRRRRAATGLIVSATAQHPLVALAGLRHRRRRPRAVGPTLFGVAGRLGGAGGRGSALSTVAILGYLGFLVGPP
jgi:hypothetical protein